MKNTIECKSPERDPYTAIQKIDTAIGVIFLAMFAIALVA